MSIDKKNPNQVDTLWDGGQTPRLEMAKAIDDFIWKKSKSLTGVGERAKKKDRIIGAAATSKTTAAKKVAGDDLQQRFVVSESEIKRRRYTAYMSDMVILF